MSFLIRRMTKITASLAVAFAPGVLAQEPIDIQFTVPEPVTVDFQTIKPFADYVNEVSERRRRVVYIPNQQSIFDGRIVDFVHMGDGHASFRRRDLVTVDRLPIQISRIYDSRGSAEHTLGAGQWLLNVDEYIEYESNDSAIYRDSSGALSRVVRSEDAWQFERSRPTDIVSIQGSGSAMSIVARNGLTKRYVPSASSHRLHLVNVTDRYGNSLNFDRAQDGALREIVSNSDRSVRFTYDNLGRLDGIKDDQGRSVRYLYGDTGQLDAVEDIGGYIWKYDYHDDGRLASASDPESTVDLSFLYFSDGRVSDVFAHGLNTRFEYDLPIEDHPALTGTRVTVENSKVNVLAQNSSGITVFARNALGGTSSIQLDQKNRPMQLATNGHITAEYDYDLTGRLRHLTSFTDETEEKLSYSYDSAGDLVSITSDTGKRLVDVQSMPGARVRVATPHSTRTYQLSAEGDLTRYATGSHKYSVEVTDRGQPQRVTDANNRSVALDYWPSGKLSSITYPTGEIRSFIYNELGLRSKSYLSTGTTRRFDYAPTGSLENYTLFSGSDVDSHTRYRLNDDEQLEQMTVDQDGYEFHYQSTGELTTISWDRGILRFAYDSQGRFESVTNGLGESWMYEYRDDEVDVLIRADTYTSIGVSGRISSDDSFASYSELIRNRTQRSLYGPVYLNDKTGQFELAGQYGVGLPGHVEIEALERARLIGSSTGEPTITTGDAAATFKFGAPSNVVYVPSEFWSLNCNACPIDDPHGMGQNRDAGIEPGQSSLDDIVIGLEACSFGNGGGAGGTGPGSGGTGGNTGNITNASGLPAGMDALVTRITNVGQVWNAIGLTLTVANIATGTIANTLLWAKRDIDTFREIGLHVPQAQGSLIPWQTIQVDWTQYGSNSSATTEQVLINFINAAENP